MFTGIITHQGTVQENDGHTLTIEALKDFLDTLTKGASVGVNGVCFTIITQSKTSFAVQYMEETAKKTTVAALQGGDIVNLERSATLGTHLDGHIVKGAVDGTGTIEDIITKEKSWIFKIKAPKNITQLLVKKGAISVNGISLTLIDVEESSFTVGIIPHTYTHTTMQYLQKDDIVNIEVDILAKYVYAFTKNT